MKILPDPKGIIDSDAFSLWCEEVGKYIENFESEMLKAVALEQRREAIRPVIAQCIGSKKTPEHLKSLGWYPMIKRNAEVIRKKCLLFAPLSESSLKAICDKKYQYTIEGQNLTVRLKRSRLFIDRERELFCYMGQDDAASGRAKHEHMAELGFPFLPYSRKFLEVELFGDFETRDERLLRTNFTADNLYLKPGNSASQLGFSENMLPYWNVDSFNKTIPGKKCSLKSVYKESSDNHQKLIIHRALDSEKKPVSIQMMGEFIESELQFKYIEASIISEVQPISAKSKKDLEIKYPIFGDQPKNTQDIFWYRNFLQSMTLTQRDLDVLVTLLPETQGKLHVVETQLAGCHDDHQYDELVTDVKRPYFDYLWYLDHLELTQRVGRGNLKLLFIYLESTEKVDKRSDFLLEDRVNYFVSICKLSLPMNFECLGFLRKK